jgi:hypothetical protein
LVPVAVTRKSDDRVVVAVDPHKASWTAAAVDGSLQPLAIVRVPVGHDGSADYAAAYRWHRGDRRPGEAGRSGASAVERARPQKRRR